MALTQRDWVNDEAPAIDAIYLNELDDEVRRLDTAKVGLTGNETVNGIKTFTSSPIVPTPTTDYQVANKEYVDKAVENGPLILTPGTKRLGETSKSASTSATSYTKVIEYFTASAGEILVSFDLCRDGQYTGTVYARIYVNGVAVGAERVTSSSTLTTYQENITVERGDYIQLYAKRDGSSAEITNFELLVDELPYSRYTL